MEYIFKQKKGITLIALVITIIVLLILAGISISMLSGNNSILNRANEAKEKSSNKEIAEKVKLAVLSALSDGMGKINNAKLRTELINGIDGVTENDITGNEKYGWQVKIENKAYAIERNGEVNEATWIVYEDGSIGTADGSVTGLKIGDTINYNAKEGVLDSEKTITSYIAKNGIEDQTISLDNYEGTWRLLGVEKGRLNIVSQVLVGIPGTKNGRILSSNYLKLNGKTGYENAEEELNRVCGLYGKGTYAESARSINVNDINKITGYDPEHTGVNVNTATEEQLANGTKYEAGKIEQYGNKVTYSWNGEVFPTYESSVTSGKLWTHNLRNLVSFSWYDGRKFQKSDYFEGKTGKICELTSDYYKYYPETLSKTDDTTKSVGLSSTSVEKDLLFNVGDDSYWLNSKSTYCRDDHVWYSIRIVNMNNVDSLRLALSNGKDDWVGAGLRPVVSLKSDIKLSKDNVGTWQFVEE